MSFTDSFWTAEHSTGLKVLFDKLKQGCAENNELLEMVTDRVKLENAYGGGLQSFPVRHEPKSEGFDRDDGASLKQAYSGYLGEIAAEGLIHTRIANDLEKNVRLPFHRWSQGHKRRVLDAETLILNRVTTHYKNQQKVTKLQQGYFAKCRQLEELDPSGGGLSLANGFSLSAYLDNSRDKDDKAGTKAGTNAKMSISTLSYDLARINPFKQQDPSISETPVKQQGSSEKSGDSSTTLGDSVYSEDTVGVLLHSMLQEVPRQVYKIPIIGSYKNVSTSSDISLWVRKRLQYANLAKAERFGQDLIDNGFLKPLGLANRGKFQCSDTSRYQWLPKALEFEHTDRPVKTSVSHSSDEKALPDPPQSPPERITTEQHDSVEIPAPVVDEPKKPETSSNSAHHREKLKLQKEIEDADGRYREAVMILDDDRWDLEDEIRKTLLYLENCERERLKVFKKAFLNFANDILMNQRALPSVSERMLLYEESVQPSKDIEYMVKNYRTGGFIPNSVTYENFNSALKIQTFGVSILYSSFAVPLFLEYISHKLIELDKSQVKEESGGEETNANVNATKESDKLEETEKLGEDVSVATSVESESSKDKDGESQAQTETQSQSSTNSPDSPVRKPSSSPSPSPPPLPEKPKKVRFSTEVSGTEDIDFNRELKPLEMWAQRTHQVPSIHQLRKQINTGEPFDPELLAFFPLSTVIGTFCQYLLELPDSLISFGIYDVTKNIYSTEYAETADRLDAIAAALVQTEEIAVKLLKLLIEHFINLKGIYLSDKDPGNSEDSGTTWRPIAVTIAPYLLRPRVTNGLTMSDKHPKLLVEDLFTFSKEIFDLVAQKRAKLESRRRERSVSTSRHNRKAAIEERNRALASSRQGSPVRTSDSPTPAVVSSSGLIPLALSPTSETSLNINPYRRSNMSNMGMNGDTPTKRNSAGISITPVVRVDPPSPEQAKN